MSSPRSAHIDRKERNVVSMGIVRRSEDAGGSPPRINIVAIAQTNLPSACGVDARMLRYPDVSATQIAFVYAGDIWVAPKNGGSALRLSSPKGEETFPRFSPDGSQIAFSGNYDGNTDIYVVTSTGGLPKRLTYHGDPDRMFAAPAHPYTQALVSAIPVAHRSGRQRLILKGDPPNPVDVPAGCAFHERCPIAVARCRAETPALRPLADGRHVACHLAT
jgi:oligopeptide/dipeptide ABC transporter ATP-binding protein